MIRGERYVRCPIEGSTQTCTTSSLAQLAQVLKRWEEITCLPVTGRSVVEQWARYPEVKGSTFQLFIDFQISYLR